MPSSRAGKIVRCPECKSVIRLAKPTSSELNSGKPIPMAAELVEPPSIDTGKAEVKTFPSIDATSGDNPPKDVVNPDSPERETLAIRDLAFELPAPDSQPPAAQNPESQESGSRTPEKVAPEKVAPVNPTPPSSEPADPVQPGKPRLHEPGTPVQKDVPATKKVKRKRVKKKKTDSPVSPDNESAAAKTETAKIKQPVPQPPKRKSKLDVPAPPRIAGSASESNVIPGSKRPATKQTGATASTPKKRAKKKPAAKKPAAKKPAARKTEQPKPTAPKNPAVQSPPASKEPATKSPEPSKPSAHSPEPPAPEPSSPETPAPRPPQFAPSGIDVGPAPTPPPAPAASIINSSAPRLEVPAPIIKTKATPVAANVEIEAAEPAETVQASTPQSIQARATKARSDRVVLTRFIAACVCLLGLINLGPAIYHWLAWTGVEESGAMPRWIYIQVFVAALHVVYAVFLIQIPDWSALRAVSIAMLAFAVVFGALGTGLLLGGSQSPIARGLELATVLRSSAAIWCVVMLILTTLVSYAGGKEASNWQRAEKLLAGIMASTGRSAT